MLKVCIGNALWRIQWSSYDQAQVVFEARIVSCWLRSLSHVIHLLEIISLMNHSFNLQKIFFCKLFKVTTLIFTGNSHGHLTFLWANKPWASKSLVFSKSLQCSLVNLITSLNYLKNSICRFGNMVPQCGWTWVKNRHTSWLTYGVLEERRILKISSWQSCVSDNSSTCFKEIIKPQKLFKSKHIVF